MTQLKLFLKILIVIVLIIIAFTILQTSFTASDVISKNNKPAETKALHDGTFIISGQNITLENGISEIQTAPDSASKTVTRYFGNDISGDIDGDGRDDLAFLITQDGGGTGMFYYLVALLDKIDGKVGTEAVFIGDRIAPQTTELKDGGVVLVNYADRNPGESFDTAPSLGKSLYLKFDPATRDFGELVQNFEGESNIACTMDAMQCPDGSYVGRSGPKCQFVCPK